MIHERASGIVVSHSITSGKESLGKPLEQEYLVRVCIILARRFRTAKAIASRKEEKKKKNEREGEDFAVAFATNERAPDTY